MKEVKSAGLAVFNTRPPLRVLLVKFKHPMYKHISIVEFPKGRVEPGEKLLDAAIRETHEETGLDPKDIHLIPGIAPLKFDYVSAFNEHKHVVIWPAFCKKCVHKPKTEEADVVWFATIDEALAKITKQQEKEWLCKIVPRVYKLLISQF